MITALNNTQQGELYGALLSAFPNRGMLERLSWHHLGQRLYVIASDKNLADTVSDLIGWADSRGRIGDLITAAVRDNPDNPALRAFLTQINGEIGGKATQQEVTPNRAVGNGPTPTEPATVLLAYMVGDIAVVDKLAVLLQARGLRVKRAVHRHPTLPMDMDDLRKNVGQVADALLLYLSVSALQDAMLCRQLPAVALARRSRDRAFPIIPVLAGITPEELGRNGELADLQRLVGAGQGELIELSASDQDLRSLAGRTLNLALTHRLAREGESPKRLHMSFCTFPNQPATPSLHLCVDWSPLFPLVEGKHQPPDVDRWAQDLLPALADIGAAINRTHISEIEVWLAAHIPAAVALGYTLSPKATLNRRVFWHQVDYGSQQESVWTYSNDPLALKSEDALILTCDPIHAHASEPSLLLELPITRGEVTRDVQMWLTSQTAIPQWHLRGVPQRVGRDSIKSGAHAAIWIWQIGEQVRRQWVENQTSAVHLFTACPAAFAALLGQELYDREAHQHPIHLYHETTDKTQGYRHVCTLGVSLVPPP